MARTDSGVLPYRTDADGLIGRLEEVARGGAPRTPGTPAKTAEGAVVTAVELGFLDRSSGKPTRAGEALLLAAEQERRRIVAEAVLGYSPYRVLLEAASRHDGGQSTDVGWIETWWATHGYGGSRSNRAEATATLGRLVEYSGLGRYIPGRRGHPTRIEWLRTLPADDPASRVDEAPRPVEAARPRSVTAPPAPPAAEDRPAGRPEAEVDYNDVVVSLPRGIIARLHLPTRLPPEEKRRLVALLDLLIMEAPASDGG